jgi:hypothetical protein
MKTKNKTRIFSEEELNQFQSWVMYYVEYINVLLKRVTLLKMERLRSLKIKYSLIF